MPARKPPTQPDQPRVQCGTGLHLIPTPPAVPRETPTPTPTGYRSCPDTAAAPLPPFWLINLVAFVVVGIAAVLIVLTLYFALQSN